MKSGVPLLIGQIVFAFLLLTLLVVAPPARGPMLLVPVTKAGEARMLPLATRAGARLVGRGPLGRSYLVSADRARIAAPLLMAGIVVLAGRAAGCGEITA